MAAGVGIERWSLERVVEMTADYLRWKEDEVFEKASQKRAYENHNQSEAMMRFHMTYIV